jgi:hypothetical protein
MPISRKNKTSRRLAKLQTKKKLIQKHKQNGGATADEIKRFIEDTLTNKRIVKEKDINPIPWVWDLLSENNFFNNIYIPALVGMKNYKKKNTVHREFPNNQRKNPAFYLMNDPDDKGAQSLIANKKETFYDKSPQELYDWWLSKQKYMDENAINAMNDYPLNDTNTGTETILSVITPCIINCMTHIINSYIKYGDKLNTDKEKEAIIAVFGWFSYIYDVDITYNDLNSFIYWFALWYDIRVPEGNNVTTNADNADNVSNLFEKLISSKLFYLPMSTGLNYNKTVNMYSIPVLYFSIVNDIGHGARIAPFSNIDHDIFHNEALFNVFIASGMASAKNTITTNNLISVYTLAKDFYTEIDNLYKDAIKSKNIESIQNATDLCYILFSYLHEFAIIKSFSDFKLYEIFDRTYPYYLPCRGHTLIIDNINSLIDNANIKQFLRINGFGNDDSSDFFMIKDGKLFISGNLAHKHYIEMGTFINLNRIINDNIKKIYNSPEKLETAKLISTNKKIIR